MRVPKYRWLVSIAATVSLTVFSAGCTSTSGYKMPGLGWMSSSSPSPSSASEPAPPSVTYGANSSSAQEPSKTGAPGGRQDYPSTQFANTGVPAPTNPMGTSTRADLASTPSDPSLVGVGGPSAGGPGFASPAASNAVASNPNAQHGFYGTEYQGGVSGSRNSGMPSTNNFPITQPTGNSSFPTAQDFANQAVGQVNNAINTASNRASNFTAEKMSQLNASATNAINGASNQANQALTQWAQPGVAATNNTVDNVSKKLGALSAGMRSTAESVAQQANTVGSHAQNVANALSGNPWAPNTNGGATPWSATPAPVTSPPVAPTRTPVAGMNPRAIPGVQENPYVVPKGGIQTANAGQVNPAFSPTQNSVASPRTLPSIPKSSGYTPGSTGVNTTQSVQPAGFNGQVPTTQLPPTQPLPSRTFPPTTQSLPTQSLPAQPQPTAPRGGSFNPVNNSQIGPVGSPYPSTGF